VFAGVLASFTPFYGFHFLAAALIATIMRGNMLAALLSTFFGNPVTFPIIAWLSLRLGNWLLGTEYVEGDTGNLVSKFSGAAGELWHNFMTLFNDRAPHWDGLLRFYEQVFLPYLIGGILPGLLVATIAYYVSLPLISAYQNRRRLAIKRKLDSLARPKTKGTGPLQ